MDETEHRDDPSRRRPASASRSGRLALGLMVTLTLATACGESSGSGAAGPSGGAAALMSAQAVAAGEQRMRTELRRIAEQVVRDNRFLGTAELTRLEDQLAALPAHASAHSRYRLHSGISAQLLRLGQIDEAIVALADAAAVLPELPAEQRGHSEALLQFYSGLAWMRYGDYANCVASFNVDSCLAPLRGGGIHGEPLGAQRAMESFAAFLDNPEHNPAHDLSARWLLNIAAMERGSWPDGVREGLRIPLAVFDSGVPFPRFPNVAAELGLDTLGLSGGAVVEDFDGDGLLDVMVSTWHYLGPLRLFHNEGDGRFGERSKEAGLEGLFGGLCLIHADYDSDGDQDVLVLRGAWFDDQGDHPNSLLRNDGDAHFTDVTFVSGLGERSCPTQAGAFADYDNDGQLDLYIANEDSERSYFPSQLFRNRGAGTFVDVAAEAGVLNNRYGKSAAFGDMDDDGDQDLFVSNLGAANRLYRNDGAGHFEDLAAEAGVERPEMSFGSWFFDYDNDGHLDLYVAAYVEDMDEVAASWLGLPHEHASGRLYHNDGSGHFDDVTESAGLSRLVTTMGCNLGDLDNDGWLDFYLGTGFPSYTALMPNVMYHNVNGERFEDVSAAGGFGHLQKGHAVAFCDIDDDGDQDVFEKLGGAYTGDIFRDVLYENPGHGGHWLRLRLQGVTSNADGFGVRVSAEIEEHGRRRQVHRQQPTCGSFGSNPLSLHLGLGGAGIVERLTVFWPTSGTTQVFTDVLADRVLLVREDASELVELPRRPFSLLGR